MKCTIEAENETLLDFDFNLSTTSEPDRSCPFVSLIGSVEQDYQRLLTTLTSTLIPGYLGGQG